MRAFLIPATRIPKALKPQAGDTWQVGRYSDPERRPDCIEINWAERERAIWEAKAERWAAERLEAEKGEAAEKAAVEAEKAEQARQRRLKARQRQIERELNEVANLKRVVEYWERKAKEAAADLAHEKEVAQQAVIAQEARQLVKQREAEENANERKESVLVDIWRKLLNEDHSPEQARAIARELELMHGPSDFIRGALGLDSNEPLNPS